MAKVRESYTGHDLKPLLDRHPATSQAAV